MIADGLEFPLHQNPTVSILIPVFGNINLTIECLCSISRSIVDATYEVIIADDASTDGTPEVLGKIRGITIQRGLQNRGFLRNCNAALPLLRGQYVIVLNNDVQVTDHWLDALLEVFANHHDAGAAGPKILYPSGHLQEAGVCFHADGSSEMVGLNDNPDRGCYNYIRPVDYCSGAALMLPSELFKQLGGFTDAFAPAYCEDADLCLRLSERGLKTYYTPMATVIHRLSGTMAAEGVQWKLQQVSANLVQLYERWGGKLEALARPRIIAFYLPQFQAIPENDQLSGEGLAEWASVRKARPNFVGHYQPRVPAELGYYDLSDQKVMDRQVDLARRYGVDGFCFYYYRFAGKRLLEKPLERMLESGRPDFPFCICWTNDNWSRRRDGKAHDVLIGQAHSPEDDRAVMLDLLRYFDSPNYICVDGRPLLLVYRVDLFPDFLETSNRWREVCRAEGPGEIYLALVESHDLVHRTFHPEEYGCDASVEFPPLSMAEPLPPSGDVLNGDFAGKVADYLQLAFRYCTRDLPGYTRFRGVMPGWDNTASRQNDGFCFEHATPGGFQAWLEVVLSQTRKHRHGDERLVFVNAWNEWVEGAYLEPDQRFGHTYLEAIRNARSSNRLMRKDQYRLVD